MVKPGRCELRREGGSGGSVGVRDSAADAGADGSVSLVVSSAACRRSRGPTIRWSASAVVPRCRFADGAARLARRPVRTVSADRPSQLSARLGPGSPNSNQHSTVTGHRHGRYRWPSRPPPRLSARTRQPSAATTSEASTCRYSESTCPSWTIAHLSPGRHECSQLTARVVPNCRHGCGLPRPRPCVRYGRTR